MPCYILHCKQAEKLDKFLIREWGGDRGNMWDARREGNRGVKDGDKPMFKEMGWQAQ